MRTVFAVLVVALAACVDSAGVVTAPDSLARSDDPLALTFDELSKQSVDAGDVSRGDGFAYAALAVRWGVTPSRLDVQVGGVVETFDAFVSAVDWESSIAVGLRPPAHRSLVAWRRNQANGVIRVLSVTSPSDSAAITSPLSLSATSPVSAIYAGASALLQETTLARGQVPGAIPPGSAMWIGMRGWVRLRETAVTGACGTSGSAFVSRGVSCSQSKYAVAFDVAAQQLAARPMQVVSTAPLVTVVARAADGINGYKLKFSCAAVSSKTGCG